MEKEGGMAFIESLAELLRRLLDYRTVELENRDLHMHVMFNLLVRRAVRRWEGVAFSGVGVAFVNVYLFVVELLQRDGS